MEVHFQFFKKLNFFHIFLVFLHNMCEKNHRQTNRTNQGSMMSHALFHFIHEVILNSCSRSGSSNRDKLCFTKRKMLHLIPNVDRRTRVKLTLCSQCSFSLFCGIICGLTLVPLTKRKKMACYAIQQPPTAERLLTFVHFPPCPHIPYHPAFGI